MTYSLTMVGSPSSSASRSVQPSSFAFASLFGLLSAVPLPPLDSTISLPSSSYSASSLRSSTSTTSSTAATAGEEVFLLFLAGSGSATTTASSSLSRTFCLLSFSRGATSPAEVLAVVDRLRGGSALEVVGAVAFLLGWGFSSLTAGARDDLVRRWAAPWGGATVDAKGFRSSRAFPFIFSWSLFLSPFFPPLVTSPKAERLPVTVPAPGFVRPNEAEFEGLAAADTAELCRRMTGRFDLSAAEPAPAPPPPSTVLEAPEPRVGTVRADLERVATGGMPEAGGAFSSTRRVNRRV